jgi:hypothetical protein
MSGLGLSLVRRGSRLKAQDLGVRDNGSERCSGFRVQGSEFRVQGSGFRVQGSRSRV